MGPVLGPTSGRGRASLIQRAIDQNAAFTGVCPFVHCGEALAKHLLPVFMIATESQSPEQQRAAIQGTNMLSLNHIKITPPDEQVLQLLMQGCSNKEIAAQLNISPRTVKQHLRTLFLRAGIRDGRKRVKLATAVFVKEQMKSCSPVSG
jgi:DNA-binding NarL/FixJ family response regulator